MPIFRYKCQECNAEFELLLPRFESPAECPKCGSAQLEKALNRVGVISLDFIGQDNAEVAYQLETEFGILTRCGLHCAPSAHKSLDTFPRGTVRFSLGFANTEADVDAALTAIRSVSESESVFQ